MSLFIYDNMNSVCNIIYDGTPHYFIKNLQGDVIALVDDCANLVARYVYDAWGKCTVLNNLGMDISNGIGYPATVNPFRYRGYYLDSETGLYYLQSRYYDPTTGRFINGDEAVFLTSTSTQTSVNSFIYCENDCIDMIDYTGFYAIKRWMVSTPIDILLCLIPGIGAAFAPIKSMAKTYGKTVLKSKIKTPLASFIKFVAKHAKKLIEGFKNIVKKIPWFGKSLAKKIPVDKLTNMIAGATSSTVINKVINVLVPNIDIVLSIGGAIAGILDYLLDKNLNNNIWEL